MPKIPYIRFALNRVCAKKSKGDFEKFSQNVISGIAYFRNSLFPVCVKSCMGCIIVEGDSFTVQRWYVDDQKGLCRK